MSKFKELVKTIIKEAGNYPDDFNSFAFDARYGDNEKLDMLEEAYAVKIEKGTIINDANSDVNNPFVINDGKFYVAKTNNDENINRFGLFEVTEDLISKYETSDYYSVFDTKDEAREDAEDYIKMELMKEYNRPFDDFEIECYVGVVVE